jgi:hypothetical protein
MDTTGRRTFLKQSACAAAAFAMGSSTAVAGANKKLILGLIGPGGMGSNHLRMLVSRQDVEVA